MVDLATAESTEMEGCVTNRTIVITLQSVVFGAGNRVLSICPLCFALTICLHPLVTCCQCFYCCRWSVPAPGRRSLCCLPACHRAGLWAVSAAVGRKKVDTWKWVIEVAQQPSSKATTGGEKNGCKERKQSEDLSKSQYETKIVCGKIILNVANEKTMFLLTTITWMYFLDLQILKNDVLLFTLVLRLNWISHIPCFSSM